MIHYSVSLQIHESIAQDFPIWLESHVRSMLDLEYFIDAKIFQEWKSPLNFVVDYKLQDRESLERYLKDEAPRMRAEGLEKFPQKFKASRKILQEMD